MYCSGLAEGYLCCHFYQLFEACNLVFHGISRTDGDGNELLQCENLNKFE